MTTGSGVNLINVRNPTQSFATVIYLIAAALGGFVCFRDGWQYKALGSASVIYFVILTIRSIRAGLKWNAGLITVRSERRTRRIQSKAVASFEFNYHNHLTLTLNDGKTVDLMPYVSLGRANGKTVAQRLNQLLQSSRSEAD